jgi:hypothetical protein
MRFLQLVARFMARGLSKEAAVKAARRAIKNGKRTT